MVSQTLSSTGLGPHSGKYGQPFSNLFKYIYIYIYIYIPQQKNTYFENRYLHAVRQFCYPVCYSNAEWCFGFFFTPSISIHLLSPFIFLLCFVLSCMCESHIFLPKKCWHHKEYALPTYLTHLMVISGVSWWV